MLCAGWLGLSLVERSYVWYLKKNEFAAWLINAGSSSHSPAPTLPPTHARGGRQHGEGGQALVFREMWAWAVLIWTQLGLGSVKHYPVDLIYCGRKRHRRSKKISSQLSLPFPCFSWSTVWRWMLGEQMFWKMALSRTLPVPRPKDVNCGGCYFSYSVYVFTS